MKHLKIAFGLLVVTAGLMAVVTSPAMAKGPRWAICERAPLEGDWEDHGCLYNGAGNYETAEIDETEEVTSSGALEMEDYAALGGKVIVQCSETGKGTVGAEGQDSITRMTAKSCVYVNNTHGACEEASSPIATPLDLPWSTHLEERENTETRKIELRDLLRSSSTQPPGWKVECRVGGVFKVSDECIGATSTAVRSNRATGAAEFVFDKVSAQEPAGCTQGISISGHLRGTISNRLRIINGVLEELRAFWALASILGT
jgi:hypothetical protein